MFWLALLIQEVADASYVEANACREYFGFPCVGSKSEFKPFDMIGYCCGSVMYMMLNYCHL